MATDQPVPFSARMRASRRQIDSDFPASGRIGLLHLLYELVDREYVIGWREIARELQRIGRWDPGLYGPGDARKARTDAEEALTALPWAGVYDFCERLYQYLPQEVTGRSGEWETEVVTSRSDVQAFISRELQRLFTEEDLAFEFSDGVVRRRGRRHTVDRISKAESFSQILASRLLESTTKKRFNSFASRRSQIMRTVSRKRSVR